MAKLIKIIIVVLMIGGGCLALNKWASDFHEYTNGVNGAHLGSRTVACDVLETK